MACTDRKEQEIPRHDGQPKLKAPDRFNALQKATAAYQTPCRSDNRYVAEPKDLTADDYDDMETRCASCNVRDLCHAYALTAKPEAGFWAGNAYPKPRPPAQRAS